MGWFSDIFGDETDGEPDHRRPSRDPFGRIESDPVFDAFRSAWRAGASLFDLFGDEPVKVKQPVGPAAPNRRPDVPRVETFLDRSGHLDLGRTEGPTGYYGRRVDAGIRGFQKDNALTVDGLINPGGPTIGTLQERIDGQSPKDRAVEPCLKLWLDARAATERVLALRREIAAKQAELRELGARMSAMKSEGPRTYTPAPPSVRRPSPGASSGRVRVRDVIQAVGEAISLVNDLSDVEGYLKDAQGREMSATMQERVKTLEGEIAALSLEEKAALAKEREAADRVEDCKQGRK